jgi:hypothetical protein
MKKLIIIAIIPMFFGCSGVPKNNENIENHKFEDLLFKYERFARKSVTIDDYKDNDEC